MNTELTTWYWRQACETLDTMQMTLVRGNYNNVVTMGYLRRAAHPPEPTGGGVSSRTRAWPSTGCA